ncbi:hypothetical protein FBU59_000038 [Linderina macrospora]|uniref:Uncharacterized protein n=1 Tax=Linderina macrospora TaxID=4868 RepID=A0ACC1JIC2_9FUNG|nr:hypothetical protein FBU59_000038 [Linderina macrospora]
MTSIRSCLSRVFAAAPRRTTLWSRQPARTATPAFRRLYASSINTNDTTTIQQATKHMQQGVDELSRGNLTQALSSFSHSLALNPTADAHYNNGVCHYSLGNVDAALEHWEKALSMDPSHSDAHVNAGNVYFMNKKDAGNAIRHLKKAIELSPGDAEVMFNLACIYEATDQLEWAIKMYDSAARLGLEKAKTHMRNAVAKQMKKSI